MSGLKLHWLNLQQPTVGPILAGSPAHAAGFKEGDILLAIGSKPVKELSKSRIQELLRSGDRQSLRVSILRGTKTKKLRLILRKEI
jgi:C-terminal processing protease CtpA/Prc